MLRAWYEAVVGPGSDPTDAAVASAVAAVDRRASAVLDAIEASGAGFFTGLPLMREESYAASQSIWQTYRNLRCLALAWRTPSSQFNNDARILRQVLQGLAVTHARAYHPGRHPFGNWYFNEIGSPRAMLETCALVKDALDPVALTNYLDTYDHFVPEPSVRTKLPHVPETGANRADKAYNHMLREVLAGDNSQLQRGYGALVDQLGQGRHSIFQYVDSGDGFYRDGSFIQHHSVPYTGHYGIDLLNAVASYTELTAGTEWSLSTTEQRFLTEVVDNTFSPMIVDGQMMDAVRGRMIGEPRNSSARRAQLLISIMLRLIRSGLIERESAWRDRCCGWLQRSPEPHHLHGSPAEVALMRDLLLDPSVTALPEPASSQIFPGMARAVHRRPGWTLTISMASRAVAWYEKGRENQAAFHLGDGMTYLYGGDRQHFDDAFWPTVDLGRLPGTTVDHPQPSKPDQFRAQRAKPARASFAGGAIFDELYSVVGTELEEMAPPDGHPLIRGRKSWFCLDDRVVAVGSGITSRTGHPAETTVENRNLGQDSQQVLLLDGVEILAGRQMFAGKAQWAHLEGVGGYIFHDTPTLRVLRERRKGSWRRLNLDGPEAPLIREFVTLWLPHKNSAASCYAYTLLPGASPQQVAEEVQQPRARIVARTPDVHAIDVPELNLTAVNFFAAGSVAGIEAERACSVILVWQTARHARIAIADPTGSTKPLRLRLAFSAISSSDVGSRNVTVDPGQFSTSVCVMPSPGDVPGQTRSVTLHA
nr:polysaccharide lyase 8 family protein [Ruania rhizosphaerae]